MPNLARVKQEIFASTAGTDERTQIGSVADGAPVYTDDPVVMQALGRYLQGLFGTCIGENSPVLEDMNSLYFLITRQLAYLFQKGVPVYLAEEVYYIGSIVNSGGILYRSITDNNTNNPVTSTVNWQPVGPENDLLRVEQNLATRRWTQETGIYRWWTNVEWSPALGFFLMGGTDTSGNPSTTNLQKSFDGINWASVTTASLSWGAIRWAPALNLFVAFTNSSIMTSPDGSTWTARTTPAGSYVDIAWSPELNLFAACPSGGTNFITSPDGINWTLRPYSGGGATMSSICWSKKLGKFCAIGNIGSSNYSYTSPDGINWTKSAAITIAGTNPTVDGIAWGEEIEKFVASSRPGLGGNQVVLYSADGTTWTQVALGVNIGFGALVYSPSLKLFTLIGQGANMVYTSPNGITWTRRVMPSTNTRLGCWSPELSLFCFAVTASSAADAVLISR